MKVMGLLLGKIIVMRGILSHLFVGIYNFKKKKVRKDYHNI